MKIKFNDKKRIAWCIDGEEYKSPNKKFKFRKIFL